MANKPNGNLTGIKSAMLDRLKSLYDFKQGLDEFASFELLSELCACSGEINREISVYICLLYTSPSPRDLSTSRMPSSA